MTFLSVSYRFTLILLLASAQGVACASAASDPDSPTLGEIRLGWNGVYKLGCWTPLEVELHGATGAAVAQVRVTVPDTDGVPTTTIKQVEDASEGLVRMMVRIGQARSTVDVRLLTENGSILDERTLHTDPDPNQGAPFSGLPATRRLLLVFGSELDLRELQRSDSIAPPFAETTILFSNRSGEMPDQWFGYEGIDTVVLTTSQPETVRPLLENPRQLEALQQWVRLGGKLVVFCTADSEALLVDEGPLSPLVPGQFSEMLPLRKSLALETFIGSEKSIRGRFQLNVPRLENVQGRVLAFAGRDAASGLPLVVRSRQGLGEQTFVALDFQSDPLSTWRGRTSFLRRVLDWPLIDLSEQQHFRSQAHAASEGDLTTRLRVALDHQFSSVSTASFALVAVLIAGFIALVGPGDYFLLKKVFRKMELTWITFPLILVGTSAGAYWLAHAMKGDELCANQLEIVDIDTTTGLARGTVWTHFFNPRVQKFDLDFSPCFPGNAALAECQSLASWQGLPGSGLGGMQSATTQTNSLNTGYTFGNSLDSLRQMPVEAWSTKTLSSRWTATVPPGIQANLQRISEEVVIGRVTNNLGVDLEDCMLLFGNWAFPLGDLAAGASTDVVEEFERPRTVKQTLTGAKAGDLPVTRVGENGMVAFDHRRTDVARIAKAMMFYHAIRGHVYTGLYNRYQPSLDLSHVLADGQAILLARCPKPASHWTHGDDPLGSNNNRHWTYYRFLLPVGE